MLRACRYKVLCHTVPKCFAPCVSYAVDTRSRRQKEAPPKRGQAVILRSQDRHECGRDNPRPKRDAISSTTVQPCANVLDHVHDYTLISFASQSSFKPSRNSFGSLSILRRAFTYFAADLIASARLSVLGSLPLLLRFE